MTLASFMRLSLRKGAHVVVSSAAWQEIRGYPGFPVELGDFGKLHAPFFTERRTRCRVQCRVAGNPGTLGMTKGRAALTLATITAGSKSRRLSTIFITLDGPQDILTGAQPVRSGAALLYCASDEYSTSRHALMGTA